MSSELKELRDAIVSKKKEINEIYNKVLFPAKEELTKLMNKAAQKICPFNIGERIVFENGKEGEITAITYFSIDFFLNSFGIAPATTLDYEEADTFDNSQAITIDYNQEEFTFTWQIEGVMINQDNKAGKRNFRPKNPYYNKFEGNQVFEKTFRNSLDPTIFFDINDNE